MKCSAVELMRIAAGLRQAANEAEAYRLLIVRAQTSVSVLECSRACDILIGSNFDTFSQYR
ncbi:hypothetical protein EMIT0P176_70062 [Pseudomonas sp. IT-P176]